MSFITAVVSNLAQSTCTGIGEVLAGPTIMIVACPNWIRDILNNQTTYIDIAGTTPRSLCIMGAEATYDGFWRLAYIPCLYVGYTLASRTVQYYMKG
jgi:hypothetical protein